MEKGCYGIWVIVCVYCIVFLVLYEECVEFETIKCGLRSMGFCVGSFGLFSRRVYSMECGCGACGFVGVLY